MQWFRPLDGSRSFPHGRGTYHVLGTSRTRSGSSSSPAPADLTRTRDFSHTGSPVPHRLGRIWPHIGAHSGRLSHCAHHTHRTCSGSSSFSCSGSQLSHKRTTHRHSSCSSTFTTSHASGLTSAPVRAATPTALIALNKPSDDHTATLDTSFRKTLSTMKRVIALANNKPLRDSLSSPLTGNNALSSSHSAVPSRTPTLASNSSSSSAWQQRPLVSSHGVHSRQKLPAPLHASSTIPPTTSPPALIPAPPSRLPTSRGDPLAWTWILPHPAMLELAPAAPSSPAWAALALAQGNNSQAFLLFLHFTNCPGTSFRLAIHLTG